MKNVIIFVGILLAGVALADPGPGDLNQQLVEAATKGNFQLMQKLLASDAQCKPVALSRFFVAIAAEQKPISDEAVRVAEQLFPRVLVGIDGKSAINQSSWVNMRQGGKREVKNYLPLTWLIENYECMDNAQRIADLLIKHGADMRKLYPIKIKRVHGKKPEAEYQTPLECANKSRFAGWVQYLTKIQKQNTVPLTPVAYSPDQI